VAVGEVELRVVEQGAGPAVVLCHGFPGLAYSWRHQLPVVWDLPQWAPGRVRALIQLSVPRTGTSPVLPSTTFARVAQRHFFHLHYFQHPPAADTELAADPAGFLSRVFWALSGTAGTSTSSATRAKATATSTSSPRRPRCRGRGCRRSRHCAGHLRVAGPAGGGTVVTAELPITDILRPDGDPARRPRSRGERVTVSAEAAFVLGGALRSALARPHVGRVP
jgi:hypothetical protein